MGPVKFNVCIVAAPDTIRVPPITALLLNDIVVDVVAPDTLSAPTDVVAPVTVRPPPTVVLLLVLIVDTVATPATDNVPVRDVARATLHASYNVTLPVVMALVDTRGIFVYNPDGKHLNTRT